MTILVMRPRDVAPATGDDAPVGSTKVAVTQRVADWVDSAVDVAQPVTYITAEPLFIQAKNSTESVVGFLRANWAARK